MDLIVAELTDGSAEYVSNIAQLLTLLRLLPHVSCIVRRSIRCVLLIA